VDSTECRCGRVGYMLLTSLVHRLVVRPSAGSEHGGGAAGYRAMVASALPDDSNLDDSNIDWGQDLYYFLDWAKQHSDARPLSLAYFNNLDYRICGQEFGVVPEDPPEELDHRRMARDTYGPLPGYFALDLRNLKRPTMKHLYFERFKPIAKAGYSIFIYHITLEQANEARRDMGLPLLGEHDG